MTDLYSNVRKGFDARKIFQKAISMVQAVQKLKNVAPAAGQQSLPVFSEKLVSPDEHLE